MKPVHTFSVEPSLRPEIEGLRRIAWNLRWCWSHESIELFRRLDRDLWETSGHNPVLMLGTIEQTKLDEAANDDAFVAHLRRVESSLAPGCWKHQRGYQKGQSCKIPLPVHVILSF